MAKLLGILGLCCVACVVAVSMGMHWYVKKRADMEPERAGRIVLRGSLARTVLCIAAAVLFLVSSNMG